MPSVLAGGQTWAVQKIQGMLATSQTRKRDVKGHIQIEDGCRLGGDPAEVAGRRADGTSGLVPG